MGDVSSDDDLSLRILQSLEPDAKQREAWRDVGHRPELWKRSLSKVVARELVDQVKVQDRDAVARVYFWCPCKRTEVVPDEPSTTEAQPWDRKPDQGPTISQKTSGALLARSCYGCPVPPCMWERAASYADAADDRFKELNELSPCVSPDKPARACTALLCTPGPTMRAIDWTAAGRAATPGKPSPSLLRWGSCRVVVGGECGCVAKNVAHARGVVLPSDLPSGFAKRVTKWNCLQDRDAPWRPLRCPWCPAPAVCGDNVLHLSANAYPRLADAAALVCAQGHLLVWSLGTNHAA